MAKWLECWLAGNFESTVSILYCLYSGSCKIFGGVRDPPDLQSSNLFFSTLSYPFSLIHYC